MDYRRAVALWSSGLLAAALSVALLVASRLRGSVWHDPWFALSVAVAAAVAFVVLVVSGAPDLAGWLGARTDTASSAVITSPLTGQIVPQAVWARGSVVNVADGVTLWLVVLAGRSYYPQAKIRPPASGTGTWDQLVHFGRVDGSAGNHYTLYAVGAGAAATRAFEDYFRQRTAQQDSAPLSDAAGKYPDVTTYASVHVIRAPERRKGPAS
jgi:hypothetical protein